MHMLKIDCAGMPPLDTAGQCSDSQTKELSRPQRVSTKWVRCLTSSTSPCLQFTMQESVTPVMVSMADSMSVAGYVSETEGVMPCA